MGVLNVLKVSKKQYYIFKSNKLKENIGASEIIRFVTEELAIRLCRENNGLLINAGGGQTIFYFNNESDSINFSKDLSLALLKNYPSLEFFISHTDYDPDKDSVIKKIKELFDGLEAKKAKREQYSYIIDFGVTQECDSTRLPAVYSQYNKDEGTTEFYSKEAKAKIDMYGEMLKDKEQRKFALNFEDLGISKNEKSYVAITHIDGNRMGKKLKILGEKYENSYTPENIRERNEKYIRDLQEFSSQIKIAFEKAFNKVVETVQAKLNYLKDNGLNIKDDILPIRKVVLSGDDVCYITDARIAIDCAAIFLTELEKYKVLGEKITACAGIAMVREKYPFFKTYELSEELCRAAKASIPDDANESRIDWHIVQGEYNNLNEVRSKDYKTYDGKELLLRPLIVSEDAEAINTYANFKKDMQLIRSDKVAASKIKNMIKEMRKGEEYLDIYIKINRLNPLIKSHRTEGKTGFIDGKCVWFDAIETMDYYIPLT